MSTPAGLLGLLAEDDRLRVVAALALGARTTAQVSAGAGLDGRTTLRALSRLEAGGLVEAGKEGWTLLATRFGEAARAAAPTTEPEDHGASDPGTAAVLRAFLRDGRLARIPAVHSKRLVVLDHIARVFEIGVRYPEAEVNAMLRAFHPDHAALRRYLVDEEFLGRERGTYWRTGGSVPLE